MNLKYNGIRPAGYQLVPLTKILVNGLNGVLIADGVGVGKTISSSYIASYSSLKIGKPSLVVCPPGLIQKWLEELRNKFGITSFPIRSNEDLFTAKDEAVHLRRGKPIVYVMSNSVLSVANVRNCPSLGAILFDEIHTYRNFKAQWFSAAKGFSTRAEFRVGLSATPINNSLDDLVSELNILLPSFSWEAIQATVQELWAKDPNRLTFPLVTRFTKEKLGIHFASRKITTRIVRYPEAYVRAVRKKISEIQSHRERSSIYEVITYYRMAASSPYCFEKALHIELDSESDTKMKALIEILAEMNVITQWLIFCEYEETVNFLADNLSDWTVFKMTGSTPVFERDEVVRAFRSTPRSLLIMTSVGSEGLDFQFCQALVNYDMHWNPMRIEQRIGRIDRLGQDKDEVFVVNLLVSESIDARILGVMKRKLGIIMNSIFSISEILGDVSLVAPPSQPNLFDQSTLDFELKESNEFMSMIKNNRKLGNEDYEILSAINAEYCLPNNLIEVANMQGEEIPWTTKGKVWESWLHEIQLATDELRQLFLYYS